MVYTDEELVSELETERAANSALQARLLALEGAQKLLEQQSVMLSKTDASIAEKQEAIDGLTKRLSDQREKFNSQHEIAANKLAASTAFNKTLVNEKGALSTQLAAERARTQQVRADFEEEKAAHLKLQGEVKWEVWLMENGGNEMKPERHYLKPEPGFEWSSFASKVSRLGAIPDKTSPRPPNTPWPWYVPPGLSLRPFALWL